MNLSIGQTYNYDFKFSQTDVVAFANVTGDKNPVHLDEAFAAKTIFKTSHYAWYVKCIGILQSVWHLISRRGDYLPKAIS